MASYFACHTDPDGLLTGLYKYKVHHSDKPETRRQLLWGINEAPAAVRNEMETQQNIRRSVE
jgi:hypothetical protein